MPTSLEEAMQVSEIIANTDFIPKDYKGKPGNVLVAMQMGTEVGLPPIQALQNIAVINGRPSMWGDAVLAIVCAQPDYISHEETLDEETMTARCVITKRLKDGTNKEYIAEFSQKDAEIAGLWGQNTWKKYPKRMLQMRARGFACRDAYPNALKGMITREEAEDLPEERDISPAQPSDLNDMLKKDAEVSEVEEAEVIDVDTNQDEREANKKDILFAIGKAKTKNDMDIAQAEAAAHIAEYDEDAPELMSAFNAKVAEMKGNIEA